MKYLRIFSVKKTIKNPSLFVPVLKYFKNDLLSALGFYSYKYKVVFIAGLPKSGTTWVENQLAKIPCYNLRVVDDPNGKVANHDICDEAFVSLPKNGYSIIKTHTKYTDENFEIIKRHVPKFVVMIRDLRDMCISRYFHVKIDQTHRHYKLYNKESLENGIMHAIEVVEEQYVSWVRDWVKVAKGNPDTILLIKYEELNQSPVVIFKEILEFYEIPYDDKFVESIQSSKLNKEKDLKKELEKSISIARSTARKGKVGEWKQYFTEAHKDKFRKIAGELLIELGYEKNLDW